MLKSILQKIQSRLSLFLRAGINSTTPPHLIDRIVFSNWVCLIGSCVNALGAQANIQNGYRLLLVLNIVNQIAIVICWILNTRHKFLLARLVLLTIIYAVIIFTCAVQGPVVQIEHFLLAFAVLAFTLFHPSERRWAIAFGAVSLFGFLYFANQSGPILDLDPARGIYTAADLRTNQICYSLISILLLMALSNAYARAIKVIDDQRTELFEQGRLSALGLIACNVAHEMNSPLAAMSLQAYRLKSSLQSEDAEPGDQMAAVDRISQLSERLSIIVRNFKILSFKGEAETPIQTSFAELVRLSIELNEERLKKNNVNLKIQLHDPNAGLLCRPVALSQAFYNLIDNAIDAIKEQSGERWIRIETSENKGHFEIRVMDSGITPTAEVVKRIFESFFTTKPLGKGTGLGLAIARQTFEAHAGRIWLDSNQKNTTFVIELPCNQASEPQANTRVMI